MIVELCYEPFEHILIKESYDHNQLSNVHDELDTLFPLLKGPQYTMSAEEKDGQYKKKNKGIFLDYEMQPYCDIGKESVIVQYRNSFFDVIVNNYKYEKSNYELKSLVSYYGDGDRYRSHVDHAIYTIVTFLCKDNTKFSGGQLFFPEYNWSIDPIDNVTIIFTSRTYHEVLPVKSSDDLNRYGRFSITSFFDEKVSNVNSKFTSLKVGDAIDLDDLIGIDHIDFTS